MASDVVAAPTIAHAQQDAPQDIAAADLQKIINLRDVIFAGKHPRFKPAPIGAWTAPPASPSVTTTGSVSASASATEGQKLVAPTRPAQFTHRPPPPPHTQQQQRQEQQRQDQRQEQNQQQQNHQNHQSHQQQNQQQGQQQHNQQQNHHQQQLPNHQPPHQPQQQQQPPQLPTQQLSQQTPQQETHFPNVLLVKSDVLVKAETTLKRQRIEKEVKHQLEQRKMDGRLGMDVRDGHVVPEEDFDLESEMLNAGIHLKPVERPDDPASANKLSPFFGSEPAKARPEEAEQAQQQQIAALPPPPLPLQSQPTRAQQQQPLPPPERPVEERFVEHRPPLATPPGYQGASGPVLAARVPENLLARVGDTPMANASPRDHVRAAPSGSFAREHPPPMPLTSGSFAREHPPMPPTSHAERMHSPQPRYSATSQVRTPAAPQPVRPANMARVESQDHHVVELESGSPGPDYSRGRSPPPLMRRSPQPIKQEPLSPYGRDYRRPPTPDAYRRPVYDPRPPPREYYPQPPPPFAPPPTHYDAYYRDDAYRYAPPPVDYHRRHYSTPYAPPPVYPPRPYDDYRGYSRPPPSTRPPSLRRSPSPRRPQRRDSRSASPRRTPPRVAATPAPAPVRYDDRDPYYPPRPAAAPWATTTATRDYRAPSVHPDLYRHHAASVRPEREYFEPPPPPGSMPPGSLPPGFRAQSVRPPHPHPQMHPQPPPPQPPVFAGERPPSFAPERERYDVPGYAPQPPPPQGPPVPGYEGYQRY
ncbi:hypothetical protein EDC01DRAFT_790488 [Geopyxis carbonaria]|nr:hypothetical protein EDC01DRAFT_790488 [Geopyxis carbonaria]